MLNVVAWILLGGAVGWLAARLVRGATLGVVADVLVGVLGAIVFGLVLSLLLPGMFGLAGVNLGSWLAAGAGAALLLFLVRSLSMTVRRPMRV